MNVNKYDSHPAANIFPIANGPELDKLAADIKANGQHHPIVLHEGKILDGRRRYLACLKAEIEPKFLAWDGKGSPLDYVISTNVHRRHLSSSQRAIVALRMLPLLAEEAKERQRQSNGRGKKGAQKCAGTKGKAASIAAKLVGCCPRLVEQAKSIQASRPKLIEQVESGAVTISHAVAALQSVDQSEAQEGPQDLQAPENQMILARSIKGAGGKRNQLDLYQTPRHAIASLLHREEFTGLTWEPATGDGRIAEMLRTARYEVVESDLSSGTDFLEDERQVDNVVTNPPYSHKNEFIHHAKKCAANKIALLLPIDGLDTIGRYDLYQDTEFPLKAIYVFSKRLQFDESRSHQGMMTHAWFVWDRQHVGEPVIRWIPPNETATTMIVAKAEEAPESRVRQSIPALPPTTPSLRIASNPDGFRSKVEYHCGDSQQVLRTLPADSVDCCVTSVPYYLLRDYECEGQYGLEPSVGDWVENQLNVFREVRRVLRDSGTCWINVGDPYAYGTGSFNSHGRDKHWTSGIAEARRKMARSRPVHPKSLMFAPHRLAVALAEDGWIGRAEIILQKYGVDGCKDRPVRCHEYLYLFTKTDDYHFDSDCLRVPYAPKTSARGHSASPRRRKSESRKPAFELHPLGKLRGSVWNAGRASGAGGHPAPMPLQIAVDCVRAGCPEGGTVLEPFLGSGTTAVACVENGRHCIGIDLNRSYLDIAMKRVPGSRII
ncbi:Modification methylase RsrI [Anatilimnocola aggregata]|uniref:Modification methylase RsrI n=1 Tax=Anatilimnocola aggregata TaxID=2528021 RepID=A0A517YGV6_9BACT|nr:DNA methyltransferase [Anatilimnocola aggregata]QDU29449.1 Modification methylase RsrI [Anatilimnocola aggregata]